MTEWTESKARDYLTTAYIGAMQPFSDNSVALEERGIDHIQTLARATMMVNFLLASLRILGGQVVDAQTESTDRSVMEAYIRTEDEFFASVIKVRDAADFLGIEYERSLVPEL